MKAYHVIIPEESYSIIKYKQEELPAIAVVNTALRDFEPKEVFSWHLSIIIDFEDLIENGMPSQAERDIVDPFGDNLDVLIKGADAEKSNALFLARVTWNGTRQLIWRVFDPEIVHKTLQKIINGNDYPREFDYRMEQDTEWDYAKWYLENYE